MEKQNQRKAKVQEETETLLDRSKLYKLYKEHFDAMVNNKTTGEDLRKMMKEHGNRATFYFKAGMLILGESPRPAYPTDRHKITFPVKLDRRPIRVLPKSHKH
ncbi:hypothetical protein OESDEN_17250 [Oesophagostomum dentatum]|uniref:Uncharacterized protein n=1 Tax=Oesophagostomum dentatum TaxID=61180 RepID=A0A0B1SDQ4_OESDE|nr:hypothetical protein OESDEN_17250 [Oesophagostomum dentatum]